MPRRTKKHMLTLARRFDAVRKDGRPDWYLLAKHLADIVSPNDATEPETNSSLAAFRAVKVMMLMEGCSVRKACKLLAEGHDPHHGRSMPRLSDGTPVAFPRRIGKGWKGRDPAGLKTRYAEWAKKFK
jgi:hypothetical protein